eukprot:scaffold10242_cov56-Attheya_sp.AAC.1
MGQYHQLRQPGRWYGHNPSHFQDVASHRNIWILCNTHKQTCGYPIKHTHPYKMCGCRIPVYILCIVHADDNPVLWEKPGTANKTYCVVGVVGREISWLRVCERREKSVVYRTARSRIIVSWIAKDRGVVRVSATSKVPNYHVVPREISWRRAFERRQMMTVVLMSSPMIDPGDTGEGLAAAPL